eukprot:jgi/Chlat1/141/Chrsp1S03231
MTDITPALRDAARRYASQHGLDQTKATAKAILRPAGKRSAFSQTANEMYSNIRTMATFVSQHRRDYTEPDRLTERERDHIENEVGLFVKACRARIETLTASIPSAAKSNADMRAHQHGMVLIISERLATVTSTFDKYRAIRFQQVLNKRKSFKRGLLLKQQPSSLPPDANGKVEELLPADPQQAQLEMENRALQEELVGLADQVQQAERSMLEMSALNQLFSTHVVQQAQQIEMLYTQAVAVSANIQTGNKELHKAVSYNSSSRAYIILILAVAIFGLLFLDWYAS